MTVAELLSRISSAELVEWRAYDQLVWDEGEALPTASIPSSRPRPSGQRWIALDDPDIFDKLRRRVGV
jgi:hypothetical protein